jgi:hypothetical protein
VAAAKVKSVGMRRFWELFQALPEKLKVSPRRTITCGYGILSFFRARGGSGGLGVFIHGQVADFHRPLQADVGTDPAVTGTADH